ncbi:MAG: PIN domain-containing protein [Candidatus Bathyarchaeota archaeon]|nr:PIN domain-containing protein [Candidatus Bathyarchaeota archaeon]
MILYLDTNILLARYSKGEQGHSAAKKLIKSIEAGNAKAVTSILTLIEIVSATSRAYDRYSERDPPMKRGEIAGAFLKRITEINNLRFIPIGGDVSINIGEKTLEIPALFAFALETGSKTGLKTLDNIHLASASIASRIYGEKIDHFVTLDEDILKHREEIVAAIGVMVAAPNEIIIKNSE